jgi:biopolymer transport protein ExbD/biopolymer transport protein TolR
MRSLSRSKYRPAPVLNVTPLVDVVLVLLIIFMVVIPAMEKSAQVDLPSIFNVDPEAKSKTDPFTLSLTTDGSMYFEQDKLEPDAFLSTLRAAQEREPGRRLILRADHKALYGDVRKMFVACQEVGFPGVSLRVNELKGGAQAAGKK